MMYYIYDHDSLWAATFTLSEAISIAKKRSDHLYSPDPESDLSKYVRVVAMPSKEEIDWRKKYDV